MEQYELKRSLNMFKRELIAIAKIHSYYIKANVSIWFARLIEIYGSGIAYLFDFTGRNGFSRCAKGCGPTTAAAYFDDHSQFTACSD